MAPEPRRPHALVVEDELPIRELLRLHLGLAGFQVEEVDDGRAALALLGASTYDLVLLDVMLPGIDGVSLCHAVRASGPNKQTPILMLTARDGESDKVIGLESGADDYLTKPFGVRELIARIRAVMRRRESSEVADDARPPSRIVSGGLTLDLERRQAINRGQPIEMTKQEFDLLAQLAGRPGIVFSRGALLQQVWSGDTYVTERTVDTVVSRLRRKLERDPHDPELLLTVWGVGYKFSDTE